MWFLQLRQTEERAALSKVITFLVISTIPDPQEWVPWSGIPLTVRKGTSFKNCTSRPHPKLKETHGLVTIAARVFLGEHHKEGRFPRRLLLSM
jgi:hypothetical protein